MSQHIIHRLSTDEIEVGIGRGAIVEHLALRGGPNLIDTLGGAGRQIQADIAEGWPGQSVMGTPWRTDCINPTQGSGVDEPEKGCPVVIKASSATVFQAVVSAKDFTPEFYRGVYRQEYADIWPETYWRIRVSYEAKGKHLLIRHDLWHEDERDHFFRQARVATYLEASLFQPPWGNEDKRVFGSFRDSRIDDDEVWHASAQAGALIRQVTKWKNPGETYYDADSRCEDDIMRQGSPGRCQVMMAQSSYRRLHWIKGREIIEANTTITVEPYTECEYFPVGVI